MAGSRRSRRRSSIPANSNTRRRRRRRLRQDRRRPVSRRSRCRRPQAPLLHRRRRPVAPERPPPVEPAAGQLPAAAGQSAAAAAGRYRSAAGRYGRHRDADAENPQRPGGVFRPRQDHRPHHFVRCGDRRNSAIRRAAGHRAGLLHAPADRGDEYGRLRRRRRGDAQGRDQAHLHRLDVRVEPGPACGRASDLRRLADRLLPTHPGAGAGGAIDDTIAGSRGACAATAAPASDPAPASRRPPAPAAPAR